MRPVMERPKQINRSKDWHSLSGAELERIFRTDGATGLSEKEAQRRLRHAKNTVWELQTVSVKKYAQRSFLDLTTVLLVISVLALAFFGHGDMAFAVCVMLALGRAARIWVYISAERTFEANATAGLPRAKVVRGGTVKVVPSTQVVVGDVIILDSGDTVPCDIRLTAADSILVSEANVTGVEGIISKNSQAISQVEGKDIPISARTNTVYASSVVIRGFAIGIAVACGDDTLICAREGRIVLTGENDVATVEDLSDWGRVSSLSLLGAAVVITFIDIAFGKSSLADAFLPSLAMAAAGLGEFIAAVGAWAWARKLKSRGQTVLAKASMAEKAANTDVMILRSVDVMRSGKTTLHSYYKNGELTMMGTEGAKAPLDLLRLCCYCTGASPEGGIVQGAFETRMSTQGVLPYRLVRSLWEDNKGDSDAGEPRYSIVQHLPAGDMGALGLDSVLLARNNSFYFAVTGSIDKVLSMSSYVRYNGEKQPLTLEIRNKIAAFATELSKHGVTISAVGMRESHYNNLRRISVLQANLCFEGFVAVADRPGDGVCHQLSQLRSSGARTIIFTEKGEEDLFYAKAEGVFETGDIYYTAEESKGIKSLSLEKGKLWMIETHGGAEGIRERLRYIKLCCEDELFVTYVGYGIEDMWSMKNAQASFAVPTQSGVLPQGIRTLAHGISDGKDGGLSGVFQIISGCRRALSNIKNILKYLIASHSARLVLMLLTAAAGLGLPSAACLVLWGVIVDFAVSFAGAHCPGSGQGTELKCGRISLAPNGALEVLFPTMYGALAAVISVATPFVAAALISALGYPVEINKAGIMTCIFVSALLVMPFIGAELMGGYGLFSKQSRLGKMFAVPFAVTAIGAFLALFAANAAFATAFPGWIVTAFTLLPAAVTVGVMSVVRAVRKKV